jgi:uncharacterized protein YigE (DUF2233 family)
MRFSPRLFPRFFSRPLLSAASALAALSVLAFSATATRSAPPGLVPDDEVAVLSVPDIEPTAPVPQATPVALPPVLATVRCVPKRRVVQGADMVPLAFVAQATGATLSPAGRGWKLNYFGHTIEVFPYQRGARLDSIAVTLPVAPQVLGGALYVPWSPIAEKLGVEWQVGKEDKNSSTFLLQFPGAFIESARSQSYGDRVRIVLTLSNPTRITQSQAGLENVFQMAAARREGVLSEVKAGDYLVPRALISSGNGRARLSVRTNYSAPVRWFTMGFPSRLVIDVQRLFEEKSNSPLSGGLALTKIRRGLPDGPVQMFVVRVDPRDGWRMKLASSGSSGTGVLTRAKPSRLARSHKALVAVNGGFFAYDGAAVGAVLTQGEWIRLPWKGRTGLGFRDDGRARIGNLQANALAIFGDGSRVPIRDLNGWPDVGRVTALTSRFGKFYQLRPGEMALQIKDGVVASKPGGGGVNIPKGGCVLVASTGARPALEHIARGTRAFLHIEAPGWKGFTTALGGGPRLVKNGRIEVTALRESFREDVRVGRGPRTAFGIDKQGRYIILVVDGRRPFYSIGLTLNELAATMQKLGAVDALNLDGGGSTTMAVRAQVVNKPSDGFERPVSNALLVMRD